MKYHIFLSIHTSRFQTLYGSCSYNRYNSLFSSRAIIENEFLNGKVLLYYKELTVLYKSILVLNML